ncbi:UPF0561 protein C2orf68 homolog isoform X2 [Cyprinus carpio]|uniref:UPF0561 protein C2orf68 homolog isoform X2 n=1 Tax=Cyprinus carpio TaxID=7962 RepID=A0A9R0AW83_CYPCA|nr:UPF0561 protein C2orf68 homolog isoform X2 [Cyprinus carpio]
MEVMCDAEGESVKYKPGGRLDMSHGFLRHIRRNQIARDDYDREVKQAKEKQRRRHTTTPRRPRRPDRQVYHPRLRNGSEPGVNAEAEDWNESSSGTEPENTGTELFWLDYQADSGQITSLIVHKFCFFCSFLPQRKKEGNCDFYLTIWTFILSIQNLYLFSEF